MSEKDEYYLSVFSSAVAANGRNPGGSADFCLIRVRGTGCGEGKSLEHPPGHEERETESNTECFGSLHLGDLRITLLGFNISGGFSALYTVFFPGYFPKHVSYVPYCLD